MSPEQQAQIRHLMRKGKQLPMPKSELLKSVSKKKGIGQTLLKTPKTETSSATTATNVERFLYYNK